MKLFHVYVCLQQQLSEAKECLKAASRLSEQLEKKDEQIERLDEEGNYFQKLYIVLPASCFLFMAWLVFFKLNCIVFYSHHKK